MKKSQYSNSSSQPESTPEERLSRSRSEIVSFMQKDNQVYQIIKPIVSSYATSHPVKTLGIAAGIGAAIVILKPWRFVTLAVMASALKSLQIRKF